MPDHSSSEPPEQPTIDHARLEALLSAARDAIISIDDHGIITLFNRGASDIFGYSTEEALGENVSMLMTETEAFRHDGYLQNYFETGRKHVVDRVRRLLAKRKNGEVFPIQLSVSEARVRDERFFIAIIRDESQLQRMQDELRQQRDFAHRLIETAPSIVLVLDNHGAIIQYNRQLELLSGRPLSETLGDSFIRTFLPEDQQAAFGELFGRALDNPESTQRTNVSILDKENGQAPIEWSARVLTNRHSETIGLLCMGQDVGRRQRAESALAAYRRLAFDRERRADFAALISQLIHDLGNPLAGLSVQAQLVRDTARRTPDAPAGSVRDFAENILLEVRRLEGQVRNLLAFSREEQRLHRSNLDAQDFLDRLLTLWKPVADNSSIELLGQVDGVRGFQADEEKLRRVVENLIKNAIEALSEHGGNQIEVLLEPLGSSGVRVSVKDNGPGIPDGLNPFGLFESTKDTGSGLGLSLSRQFIQAHGGELSYQNSSEGGACFKIELPNADRSQN